MPTVAVVGTGFIGPVHVEALKRLNIPVKGILGSSPVKSQQAASSLALRHAYTTFDDILNDPDIDVVHITSPNHLHLSQASHAIEAGKHVICEKPLAMTSEETGRLLELANSRPALITAVNYNVRFYPLVLQARELVQGGELGEIYSVQGSYLQDWLLKDSDWNWRLEADKGGKLRAVGDIGTHWMDTVQFVLGQKITHVMAELATFVKQRKKPSGDVETFSRKVTEDYLEVPISTEDYGAMLLRFAGGTRGLMNVSQVSAGRKNRLGFEIYGSKASLAWNSERPNELSLGYRDKANELILKDPALLHDAVLPYTNYPGGHTEGFPDTFKQLYRAIYGYLAASDFSAPKPYPTFQDGHDEVMLCEKILQSHQEQRWISVA